MSLVASGLFQLMYAKRRFHKIQGSKRLLEPLYKPFWAGPDFKMADRIQKLVKHPHQERVFPEYGHLSCHIFFLHLLSNTTIRQLKQDSPLIQF
jgi:hypothetical protein